MSQPRFLYRETFPKRGFERNCPYIHKILVGGVYVDAPKTRVSAEVTAKINEIIRRENAERLLRMPTQDDGVN
jgi:hypothetical protein